MHQRLLLRTLFLVAFSVVSQAYAQTPGQAGGAPTAPATPLRLVKSLSGTKGEIRDGRFVILDPRNTFRLPEDANVVVYFEWLGTPGKHLMVGTWRGPANTSTTSSFEYVATDRSFSAYWELTLPPTAPRGQWVLEATVDGMPAGVHPFEVVGPEATAPAIAATRTPLTRPEVFARTLEASVLVEALDAVGTRVALAPGFLLGPGAVATTLSAIENATKLRVRSRKGHSSEAAGLVGFDRAAGWALVPIAEDGVATSLVRSNAEARPGELCYSTAISAEGTLMVTPCEIVGTNEANGAGARINLASGQQPASPGAPVLNEFGEVIGMVTEPPPDQILLTQQAIRLGQTGDLPTSIPLPLPIALPASALPSPPWPPVTSLAALADGGAFVPTVTLGRHVAMGGFTQKAPSKDAVVPEGQRLEFATADETMSSFVTWVPAERVRGISNFRLYDRNNKLIGEGQPHRINVRARQASMSVWTFPVPRPGLYRADVLLDGAVAWRGYFRVKP